MKIQKLKNELVISNWRKHSFLYKRCISAGGYNNAIVEFLTIKTTNEIWVSMKDIGNGIGVKKHI